MALTDYSTTPANNNAAPPNGAPEGMAAASVNNTQRQFRADVKGGVPFTISTKALMSALDAGKLDAGNLVTMTSLSTSGDGGGGLFRVTKSDISTEVTGDPLGGVFVPFDSDATGASGGFIRNDTLLILPTWFGDMTGDVSIPINAAIDFAAVGGGGTVFVPTGTFQSENPIRFKSNVWLTGAGIGNTTIKVIVFASVAAANAAFQQTEGVITIGDDAPVDHVMLSNMTIDGQGLLQPTSGPDGEFHSLSLRRVTNFWLLDLEVLDGPRDTIALSGFALISQASDINTGFLNNLVIGASANRRSLSFIDAVENVTGSNIEITGGNGGGLTFEPGSGKRKVNNIRLSNITIDGGSSNIIYTSFNDTNVPTDIHLVNVTGKNATGLAVNVGASINCSITNGRFSGMATGGIETGTVRSKSVNLVLNDVQFDGTGGGVGRGAFFRALDGLTMNDVWCDNFTSVGIQITESTATEITSDVNISSCKSRGNGGNGIFVEAGVFNVRILNSDVLNNGADGIMLSQLDATDPNIKVIGCDTFDNVGAGIRTNYIAGHTGSTLIMNCRSKDTGSGVQLFGLDLDADFNFGIVTGNDFRGNVTTSIAGTVGASGIGGTGTENIV